jgi:hypothetical protein
MYEMSFVCLQFTDMVIVLTFEVMFDKFDVTAGQVVSSSEVISSNRNNSN